MLIKPRSIKPSANALFWGIGNSNNYYSWNSAGKNGMEFRFSSGAASGDTRGIYMRLKLSGAGGGEAGRFYSSVEGTAVATGGTINGIHATLDIPASMAISGQGSALRATLSAAAQSRTLGGTNAVLLLDSSFGTGNTVPATTNGWGFIRFNDLDSVKMPNLLVMPAAPANGTIFAAHTTQGMTHSIRFIANGTAYYIMVTDAATNRS